MSGGAVPDQSVPGAESVAVSCDGAGAVPTSSEWVIAEDVTGLTINCPIVWNTSAEAQARVLDTLRSRVIQGRGGMVRPTDNGSSTTP